MTSPINRFLAGSKEIRDAATPGPWTPTKDSNIAFGKVLKNTRGTVQIEKGGGWIIEDCSVDWTNESDPKFIAHARNTAETKDAIIALAVEALGLYLNDGIWHRDTVRKHALETIEAINSLAEKAMK